MSLFLPSSPHVMHGTSELRRWRGSPGCYLWM